MTPPTLDLPPAGVVTAAHWTASAVQPWSPSPDLLGRRELFTPTVVASAAGPANAWPDQTTASPPVEQVDELRRALNMRDADADDRWATARVLEMYTSVIPDDQVVEMTADQFIRGEF